MQNKTSLLLGGLALATLFAAPIFADTNVVHNQPSTVKVNITMEQAKTIALKAFPGKIAAAELEREQGGSGQRYSFDIKRGKVTQEVGVDAETGQVLENQQEGSHPD